MSQRLITPAGYPNSENECSITGRTNMASIATMSNNRIRRSWRLDAEVHSYGYIGLLLFRFCVISVLAKVLRKRSND